MSGAISCDKVYRYKGKNVTKKVYERKIKQRESCLQMHAKKSESKKETTLHQENKAFVAEGRRIIDIGVLAKNMECPVCHQVLSLASVEKETLKGLASIFQIRCHGCLKLCTVHSSNYTFSDERDLRKKIYDVNSRAVLGSLNAGMGYTHLNKLVSTVNIPCMDNKLFKRHERIVGPSIETVAQSNCIDAVVQERDATINNLDSITKMLPDNLSSEFFIHSSSGVDENTCMNESDEQPRVRLMASYDMGWSKRGTGRSYDSLNGFGAMIGSETGLVLNYGTRNRKCRLCDIGRDKSLHDCRCNFAGSAKAMEGDLAAELATDNMVLNSCNSDIGILIGDEDSSTIAAIRRNTSQKVIKLSDIVLSLLHQICNQ